MKIYFIKYRTLYTVLAVILLLLIVFLVTIYLVNGKSIKTFYNEDVFYKGNINEKIMAFTCNVDWGNENIPKMLEIFRKHDIKITFFVTGRWAEKNTDLLKQIFNAGHEIGNHGYLHRDYSMLSYEMNRKEIEKTDKIIYQILGIKPKYFAPPAGAYNKDTVKAAEDLNYNVIMWSIDTIDWREDSTKEKIISRVISKAENSSIVLMHPKEETVKALPDIINILKGKGYKIGRVSDVMKSK